MAQTQVISLPAMPQTSSAVDLSTQTVQSWDVSDAQYITISFTGTTTAPGPQVQVAHSIESTATFFLLGYPSSGMSPVLASSISALTLVVAYKQLRVTTTSVRTGVGTANASKLIIV